MQAPKFSQAYGLPPPGFPSWESAAGTLAQSLTRLNRILQSADTELKRARAAHEALLRTCHQNGETVAHARLTRQEQQVAALVALGKSNHEIATLLQVSVHTARTHTAHILRKLNLRSRWQLVDSSPE